MRQTAAKIFRLACEAQSGKIERGILEIHCSTLGRSTISGTSPGHRAIIKITNQRLYRNLLFGGHLGFMESYMDGDWESPDIVSLFEFIYDNYESMVAKSEANYITRLLDFFSHWLNANSRKQARKNIAHHYDLGNDFYRLWLDDSMTYSSALYRTGQESLERAQEQKYAQLCDTMGAQPGDHVLEIGCGWGGFAEYAARERGLRVTCLTISKEQYIYAVDRIARAGLSDRVTFKLQDYRDETGTYDGIASIEMFEAVGERYWPVYFDTLRERLKPGRRATLQIITVQDARFEIYRRSVDFIQKYIFPGGMLPSPTALRREVERAGLSVLGSVEFGTSYSQTLRRWFDTFNDRWEEVAALGFDDRFRRMWNLYLASCAGTFQGGNCDVTQITVTRP